MGHFVYVSDASDAPRERAVGLFADARDVSSIHECAELLGVCDMTIRRLISRGELESIRVGKAVRVTKPALIRFVESQEAAYDI